MQEYSTSFDARDLLNTLTSHPGVYRMLDSSGKVLYVGKARNLRKRVTSYFRRTGLSPKTRALVEQIADIEITVTHTESEALLLENNLIKKFMPRYNILLRDDKSYPYIYLSSGQEFPRLGFHRGARRRKGRYFGPYPSSGAVRDSLHLLQKLFKVRQCEESFFKNRNRPCLQYQIKRCTAPCVGYVSPEVYAADVDNTIMFLEGKSSSIIDTLVTRMEAAAAGLDYEQAAEHRDQIASLRRVQERQYVSNEKGDLDIVACAADRGSACVQVFFIRGGRNLGNTVFFPKIPVEASEADILAAFITQYYLGKNVPSELLLSHAPDDTDLIQTVLSEQAGHKVKLTTGVRAERARWLGLAINNADQALTTHLNTRKGYTGRLQALQQALGLEELPVRMECFDISHTRGESTVASCVVFGKEGALKSDYRRFNIEGIEPGDDYAAMEQALTRRYTRLIKGEGKLPDLLFIDGGKGQVAAAARVIEELQVAGVQIIGIAKGPDRKPGLETLYSPGRRQPVVLPSNSPGLHLIQQIRDEAHRFAITGHRKRRAKSRNTSALEQIPGIGPRRRQQLLKQFGGLREVARAGVEDLLMVKGISRALAQQIYDVFHGDSA
ncbi:MAG: excinuclease ABC subunit UvrC [Gammaproteobacteria bacterium]|nr:excinuclease ABC subunit UvrC [Gammaproteobacteria bacterium]